MPPNLAVQLTAFGARDRCFFDVILLGRGGDPAALAQLAPREADVRTIYSAGSLDQSRDLLLKYHVTYIYASAAERAAYEQLDPNKLAQLGEPVFQQGNVTIYRVKP